MRLRLTFVGSRRKWRSRASVTASPARIGWSRAEDHSHHRAHPPRAGRPACIRAARPV